ncbi:MAG TPA: Uma2 family endonuclease, partial [Thermoanaerobacter sp.]|nr:Uma2 family endonuclease [Thermoanaerobacter sp.]
VICDEKGLTENNYTKSNNPNICMQLQSPLS